MIKRILIVVLLVGMVGCSQSKTIQNIDNTKKKSEERKVTKIKVEKKEEDSLLTDATLQGYKEEYFGAESDVSLGVKLLEKDKEVVVDNRSMQAASLIKLYIAGCVYESMSEIPDEVEQKIRIMICDSDNMSANDLISILGNGEPSKGMELVNAYCDKNGYKETHLGRLLLATTISSGIPLGILFLLDC